MSRRRVQGWQTPLAILGLAALAVAQILPAMSSQTVSFDLRPPDATYSGVSLTLFGWDLAFLANDMLAFVGWTANLWLLACLVARALGKARASTSLAITALACSAVGVLSLFADDNVTAVYAGAWIWLGSFVLITSSTLAWAPENRARTEVRENSRLGDGPPSSRASAGFPRGIAGPSAEAAGRDGSHDDVAIPRTNCAGLCRT